MIAAIRIRGDVDVGHKTSRTLENLNLSGRNVCVLYEDSDSVRGMLNSAKDYIAYGKVSEDTIESLSEREGFELQSGDTVNLTPPSGGFKNTKRNVNQGGSLGNRDDMDRLLDKMH